MDRVEEVLNNIINDFIEKSWFYIDLTKMIDYEDMWEEI